MNVTIEATPEEYLALYNGLRVEKEDYDAIITEPSKMLPGRRQLVATVLWARRTLKLSNERHEACFGVSRPEPQSVAVSSFEMEGYGPAPHTSAS